MATKVIEAKARISAEDRTGSVFSQVSGKLRGLENQASRTARGMDRITRGMSGVSARAAQHASIAERMSGRSLGPVVMSSGGGGAYMAAGGRFVSGVATSAAVTAAAAAPMVRSIVESSAAQINERISQRLSGLSPREMKNIGIGGGAVTSRHRSISKTESEGMIRDLVTIVGDVESAVKISDEVARLRIILKRATPGASGDDVAKQMGDIVRAADQVGATGSKEKFSAFADDFAKISNAFGGTISPSQYREFIQGTRGAASGYDRSFLTGVAPSLIQSLGPEAGVALQSLHSAVVGGQMDKSAKDELRGIGLVDKKGRIVGRDIAQRDPFRWVQDKLRPALEKKGITDEAKQGEFIDRMFSDRTARQAAKMLAFNRTQIERDRAASGRAVGLAAADQIEKGDLGTATTALRSQFDNLSSALGTSVTPRLIDLGNWIAEKTGEHAKKVAEDPKTAARTWIGGGIGAVLGGHLGLSTIGGYFGGSGLAGGVAGLTATTPLLLGATAAGAGYQMYRNYNELSAASDATQAVFDAQYERARKSLPTVPTGTKAFGFGPAGMNPAMFGGAAGQPVAKLEGAASIGLKIEVSPTTDFLVKVIQQLQASGALRTDNPTGETMR